MIEKDITSLKTILFKYSKDKECWEVGFNNFKKMFAKLPKDVRDEALRWSSEREIEDKLARRFICQSGVLDNVLDKLNGVDVDNIHLLQQLLDCLGDDVIDWTLTPEIKKRLINLKESIINRIEFLLES